jgi:hypothetical protein
MGVFESRIAAIELERIVTEFKTKEFLTEWMTNLELARSVKTVDPLFAREPRRELDIFRNFKTSNFLSHCPPSKMCYT